MPLGWMNETLAHLQETDMLRSLRECQTPPGPTIRLHGRDHLNLASNNYLDLAGHPSVKNAIHDAVDSWGWGSGASMLVSGHTTIHQELCNRLAAFEQAEDCVLFPTGFQANLGTISALVGTGDVVILDKLDHASIVDGARLSGAELRVYPHGDMRKLKRLLESASPRKTLVVTDSVFSMDGDTAPLPEICELCTHYGAMLMIDEAHATGILGAHGSGLAEACDVKSNIPIRMGTLSKALGGIGGFVVGSTTLCTFLRNHARSAIYTTALPPAAAAGAIAAIDLVAQEPWRRASVLARAQELADLLRQGGLDVATPQTPILPVVVGEAAEALQLSARLLAEGILAPAIRPPTVPRGTSRLRLSLMASHTREDIKHIADVLLRSGSHSV